jgi:S1-C subfamily serine protease
MRWIAIALFFVTATTAVQADINDRPFFGVEVQEIGKNEAAKLGLAEGRGVRVITAVPGSPAEAIGLGAEDVLVSKASLQRSGRDHQAPRCSCACCARAKSKP